MSYAEDVEKARKESIEKYLKQARGHVTTAAKLAGLTRGSFYRLLHHYGIVAPHSNYANRGNATWQSLGH